MPVLTRSPDAENFGRVLKDVHIVLSVDPRSSKALFRAARALIKLRRFEEAVDACDRKVRLHLLFLTTCVILVNQVSGVRL